VKSVYYALVKTPSQTAWEATPEEVSFCNHAMYMALMGGGSGFFVSPNTNAIMSSVEPHTRGAAAGILNMLNNTGQMLSIAIVFPLALSQIPFAAIQQVFITGGGLGKFASAIPPFLSGLHLAFLVSFILSVIAAVVAALRPSHGQEGASKIGRDVPASTSE